MINMPIELINRILGYLSRQPYGDVANMIADIQKAANPPTPSPVVPEKPKGKNGPRAEAEVALD